MADHRPTPGPLLDATGQQHDLQAIEAALDDLPGPAHAHRRVPRPLLPRHRDCLATATCCPGVATNTAADGRTALEPATPRRAHRAPQRTAGTARPPAGH